MDFEMKRGQVTIFIIMAIVHKHTPHSSNKHSAHLVEVGPRTK